MFPSSTARRARSLFISFLVDWAKYRIQGCFSAWVCFILALSMCTYVPVTWGAETDGKADTKAKNENELNVRFETLQTKDKVRIEVAYFPPEEPSKNAVPLIVIHEWKGQASPYVAFAQSLNQAGFAVVFPELRGHGASQSFFDIDGRETEFDLDAMGPKDITAMMTQDLEAVKNFLKGENDKGEINLNALTLIGIGEGAILAANWAMHDWSFADLGFKKQGRDVKGLVFVSPPKLHPKHRSLRIDSIFRNRAIPRLPILVMSGSEKKEAKEATRIQKRVTGARKRIKGASSGGLRLEIEPLKMSGPQLLLHSKTATNKIIQFIEDEIVSKDTYFRWIERSR